MESCTRTTDAPAEIINGINKKRNREEPCGRDRRASEIEYLFPLSFPLICIKPVKWLSRLFVFFFVKAMYSGQGARTETTVDHSDIRGLDPAWLVFVVELPLSCVEGHPCFRSLKRESRILHTCSSNPGRNTRHIIKTLLSEGAEKSYFNFVAPENNS